VLNGKAEESTSNFLRHHVIKVCKLSELFKYLFILSVINVFIENIFEFNSTTFLSCRLVLILERLLIKWYANQFKIKYLF
jgi:hypothetical protein